MPRMSELNCDPLVPAKAGTQITSSEQATLDSRLRGNERSNSVTPDPPVRAVRLGPRDVVVERRPDGTIHLRSPRPLAPYPGKLTERLEHWAQTAPTRIFLAQRAAGCGWRTISYGETLAQVRRVGAALLERALSPERPIVILSGNDIEHALMGLA